MSKIAGSVIATGFDSIAIDPKRYVASSQRNGPRNQCLLLACKPESRASETGDGQIRLTRGPDHNFRAERMHCEQGNGQAGRGMQKDPVTRGQIRDGFRQDSTTMTYSTAVLIA